MFEVEVVVLGLSVKSSWHLLLAAGRVLFFLGCLTDSSLWQVKHIDPICAGVPCYLTKDTPFHLQGDRLPPLHSTAPDGRLG